MVSKLHKDNKGFTIIEVLIVLAIAGLIMLIVFLAVPALQRNSRNTQRNNDASLIGGAVNECLNNKNGVIASCDTLAELEDVSLDTTKLRQLTTVNVGTGAPTMPSDDDVATANVGFSATCSDAGDAVEASTSVRQGVVAYRVEIAGGDEGVERCLEI